ncbi:hypothetical protein ACIG0C_35315 [Kitasatospora aureofaciens]
MPRFERFDKSDACAAPRNLFNRMLGQLHHCLTSRQPFDEAIAFAPPKSAPLAAAA